MKKRFVKILSLFLFCMASFNLYANENSKENNVIKFIKGNIADKISAVKESSGEDTTLLAVYTLDFVLQNVSEIGSKDTDINTLAVTGILALPSNETLKGQDIILKKLYKIFSIFDDATIRVSIIEKISSLYKISASQETLQLLANFLKTSLQDSEINETQKTAINALGKIGNGESFSVLYECLESNKFAKYNVEIINALSDIADKSLSTILRIINNSDVSKISQIFNVLKNSEKTSLSFKAEIAENILSKALYINDSSKNENSNELKFDAFKLIIQANWTRASNLVIDYFEQSKMEYQNNTISEKQFIDIINGVSLIATAKASEALSKYLSELNNMVGKGEKVSESLMIPLIKTLGELGSKVAFDPLLYVTFNSLDYSENVIEEARKALTKLKW